MIKKISLFICFILAVLLIGSGVYSQTQTAPGPMMHDHGKMMEHCKEMMAMQEKAKADMDAMDAKLDQMVADLSAAKGDQRVDALVALVNEMVTQRKSMREMMMKGMHGCPMMKHGDCPMMQK